MINTGLAGKVALISGANHGIGAATAKALAVQGAKVFLTYYRENTPYSPEELARARDANVGCDALYRALQQQPIEPIVEAITGSGGIAVASEFDLGNTENIPALFDMCESELGPVDVLINNHTIAQYETFDPDSVTDGGVGLISSEGIDAHFAVNTRAYALMMSEYVTRYIQRDASWGRIINTSTDAAHAHTQNVNYAASKHAIESYSRSAALELGKYGISVNILAPGPIQTGYITPESEVEIARGTPLGSVGQPEDIADVMVFLASEQARWVTGQLIYVGGGWRLGQSIC